MHIPGTPRSNAGNNESAGMKMEFWFWRTALTLAASFMVAGCSKKEWYKGNTHAHTVLCGHADTSPEEVTKWYHDQGYNFLVLSEHNQFIDPQTVEMPSVRREDFILIPGEEVTGGLMAHTTALNIDGLVDPRLQQPPGASKARGYPSARSWSQAAKRAHHPEPSKLSLHAHGFRYTAG